MSIIEYDQEIREKCREDMQNEFGFVHETLLDAATLIQMIQTSVADKFLMVRKVIDHQKINNFSILRGL